MNNDDIKILSTITETADMGRDSINHVIEKATDSQLKAALQKQFSQYDQAYKMAQHMLNVNGKNPQKVAAPVKMYSHMVSDIKAMTAENANSKIAEMVIQGSTMGVTEMTKELNNYQGTNQELFRTAQKFIQTEQDNIEEMKKYL